MSLGPQLRMIHSLEEVPGERGLPSDLRIREATDSDADQIAEVLSASFGDPWTAKSVREILLDHPEVPVTFVIERRDEILATASYQVQASPDPDAGWLHWVGVHPDSQGLRLGEAVCQRVVSEAARRDRSSVYLTTDDPRLPAIRTYLKLGFRPDAWHESHAERWQHVLARLDRAAKIRTGTPFESVSNYAEKVYAAVLGKIIGVYLGRPIEGWPHERILAEIGEVDHYLHEERNCPLVVTDDDISGTFTFLRALEDYGYAPNLTPAQIGETWLNYIIENRTILWWGGMGLSTEHTAYLRLKRGISAPQSGSIAENGNTVAEQIGAQIFIEGWGLINPGNPRAAADFARRAGSVSHDGEAIYGAQVIAAIVAQAFVETDILVLIESALEFIPPNSIIATMIREILEWRRSGIDWQAAFQLLKASYGYDKYGGNCHIVPNHGIVILALLFGEGNFSRSLMIANTCGWDTDCNSANVGSILGIVAGLTGIDEGYDWRGPVRDRLFLPTADGGRCVSDAVIETTEIVRAAHGIRGLPYERPKNGARFSFAFPGSLQGFSGDGVKLTHSDSALTLSLIDLQGRTRTSTFPSIEERRAGGYALLASPTLSPGQRVRARVVGLSGKVRVAIGIDRLTGDDVVEPRRGECNELEAGQALELEWMVPDCEGYPVVGVGLDIEGNPGDQVRLDWLTWDGTPNVNLVKTEKGSAWREAWVNGVSEFFDWGEPFRLIQNEGTGLLIYGVREWTDYSVQADLTLNLLVDAGIAVRVQGLRRYYGLRLTRDGRAQIVKATEGIEVLAESFFAWTFGDTVSFHLEVQGSKITGTLDGHLTLSAEDPQNPLHNGAAALFVSEGRIGTESVQIRPI